MGPEAKPDCIAGTGFKFSGGRIKSIQECEIKFFKSPREPYRRYKQIAESGIFTLNRLGIGGIDNNAALSEIRDASAEI